MKYQYINSPEVEKLIHESGKQLTEDYLSALDRRVRVIIENTIKQNSRRLTAVEVNYVKG